MSAGGVVSPAIFFQPDILFLSFVLLEQIRPAVYHLGRVRTEFLLPFFLIANERLSRTQDRSACWEFL